MVFCNSTRSAYIYCQTGNLLSSIEALPHRAVKEDEYKGFRIPAGKRPFVN